MNATPSFSLNENGSIPASARTFPRHRTCNVSQGAFSSSMKSEREAYDRAMRLLSTPGIEMDSIRLDQYYSSPSYMDEPGDTRVYDTEEECNTERITKMERYNERIC